MSTPFLLSNKDGQALTEFTMILPVLFLMFMGVIDISRALNQYLMLSRIAYEGSRYAASTAGIESAFRQDRVRTRVQGLLRDQSLDTGAVVIPNYVAFDAAAVDELQTNIVSVSIQKPFDSMFSMFSGINLRVEATAPYLYPEAS